MKYWLGIAAAKNQKDRPVIENNLAVLSVFLPLLAAPICIIISRFGRSAWVISTAVAWAVAFICTTIFIDIHSTGKIYTYHLGGWKPPIGIEFRIDKLSSAMLALVSVIAAIMMPYFLPSVNEDIPKEKQPFFYAAFLLCLSGLLGIISTNDAFNLYVFLELSSLASYLMIGLGRDRRSLLSAFQYLVLGTIGATMILIGIGFLYIMTGTLNISEMAVRLHDINQLRPIIVAFAFLAIGLCMKIALFPLHGWLSNAYAYAPSVVSAFLASVGTKVAFYAILQIFYTLFGYTFSFSGMYLALILTALSVPAIIIGTFVAVFETNLKRMLAFSSIAQVGYITLSIGLATQTGLMAGLLLMFNHAIIKGALFLAMGCFAYRLGGNVTVDNIRGLGKRMPFSSFAFIVAGLALVGFPLTGGFIAKWYLITATLEGGWWLLTALIALTSLPTMIYIWRVVEALHFGRHRMDYKNIREAPSMMVIPLFVLIAIVMICGFIGNDLVTVTGNIASHLMPARSLPNPFGAEGL